jgi:rubrerythrin
LNVSGVLNQVKAVRLWRCQFCGGPVKSVERPGSCPWCGAHEDYMVLHEAYVDRLNKIEDLTLVSRNNLLATLELEIDNIQFYNCASKKTEDELDTFKKLSLNETMHAMVVCKALGIPRPAIEDSDLCYDDFRDNLVEAHGSEHRAIAKYSRFLAEATEPKVVEIFSALLEIESDHLAMAERLME